MNWLIKNLVCTFFITYILSNAFFVSAQMHNNLYGNEWIKPLQTYFKLKIVEDGVYRIDKSVLSSNGVNLQTTLPNQFRLYTMGQEIPIYVHAINNTTEYIEFYGELKHIELDKHLYSAPEQHFNSNYSLVSDTTIYFLTWTMVGSGKRYQSSTSNFSNAPPKETFFMHKSIKKFNTNWNKGWTQQIWGYVLPKGSIDIGEGYGTSTFSQKTINIPTPHLVPNTGSPIVHIKGASKALKSHTLQITVGNHIETSPWFYGDSVINKAFSVPYQELGLSSTNIELQGLLGGGDQYNLSLVGIEYPRSFKFDNQPIFKFNIPASNQKKLLEIEDFLGGTNNQNVYIYDLDNHLRIHCFWGANKVLAMLPNSNIDRNLVLINTDYVQPITQLTPITFEDFSHTRGNYVIIAHSKLFQDSNGQNPVFDYSIYRTTTGHLTTIVPIDKLYDHFAYGVYQHPIAIKNFVAYIKQHWTTVAPKHIFLIGKGLTYDKVRMTAYPEHLIPTWGSPPSDNLLVSATGSDAPILPIGRLSATTGDQVRTYLNKIQELESTSNSVTDFEEQNWRKRILHLGGGSSDFEQSLLKNHLTDLEGITNQSILGAKVYPFYKKQQVFTQTPNSIFIDSLINTGVGLITFYGHGNTKGFDYYLNLPHKYTNAGRYPMIFALGCYNGSMHFRTPQMSEKFIFEPNAGAGAYLAFVDAVTISATKELSRFFYQSINNTPAISIGEAIQETLQNMVSTPNYNYYSTYQMASQYLSYHGDPAIQLFPKTTSDFYIDSNSIETSPKQITSNDKTFKLLVNIHNWGIMTDSLVELKIVRTNFLGKKDTLYKKIKLSFNPQLEEITFPIRGYGDLGQNIFYISINENYQIPEGPLPNAHNNNVVHAYQVNIINDQVVPLYPRDFAIVNDSNLILQAMLVNALNINQNWIIEIDTTINFNSPLKLQTTHQNNQQNILEWAPSITLQDSQVYYWRVLLPNIPNQNWQSNSFIYLPNSPTGWNQSSIYQYQQNKLERLYLNEFSPSIFKYTPSLYEISVKTGYVPDAIDDNNLALYSNGSKVSKCYCPHKNGLYVAVFDPAAKSFWTMPGSSQQFGAINCDGAGRPTNSFLFETGSSTNRQALENFLQDTIPDGHIITLYTLNDAYPQFWSTSLIQLLQNQGASQIQNFANSNTQKPYLLMYQKGNLNFPFFTEELGNNKMSVIEGATAVDIPWHEGIMSSPLIGPSKNWFSLEWKYNTLESPSSDQTMIDIWGVDNVGSKTLLYNDIQTTSFDLSNIDASQYPFLQLEMQNADISNETAAQLVYWQVLNESTTDLALILNNTNLTTNDTISENDSITLNLDIVKVGNSILDSIDLQYQVDNTPNHVTLALNSSNTTNTQINIPVIGLIGRQNLVTQIKPLDNETNYLNNWGWLEFHVKKETLITNTTKIKQISVDNIKNFPNPFKEYTNIQITLNNEELPQNILFQIYDSKGSLIKKHYQSAQYQNTWVWEGKDQHGRSLPNGVYFCKVSPKGSFNSNKQTWVKTIKLVLSR